MRAFNVELQIYFGTTLRTIFVITDADKHCTNALMTDHREKESISKHILHIWIFPHRAPSSVYGDDEFHSGSTVKRLNRHHIPLKSSTN